MGFPYVKPGDVIDGKYAVDRVLGVGGMGMVVAARHLQLEEPVAIKFLLPGQLGNPEAMRRFLQEARAAARIKSDHVARVWDVGTLEADVPFIVMEYLDGDDLARVIAQRGRLEVSDAVDTMLQTCEAMAAAHALGIVHRDLKPANVFLARRPGGVCVKVLDFGISKMLKENALTRSATPMGSPQYMCPEQFNDARDVDVRADIWALGAMAYEALAGRPPFEGATIGELYRAVTQCEVLPIHAIRGDVPAELERAILRCLMKDRAARYQHVGELARALAPYAGSSGRAAAEQVYQTLAAAGIGQVHVDTEEPELPGQGGRSGKEGQARTLDGGGLSAAISTSGLTGTRGRVPSWGAARVATGLVLVVGVALGLLSIGHPLAQWVAPQKTRAPLRAVLDGMAWRFEAARIRAEGAAATPAPPEASGEPEPRPGSREELAANPEQTAPSNPLPKAGTRPTPPSGEALGSPKTATPPSPSTSAETGASHSTKSSREGSRTEDLLDERF